MEGKDVSIYLCCYTVKEHPPFPQQEFFFFFVWVLTFGSSLALQAPAHFNAFLDILFSKSIKFLLPPPASSRLYLLEFFLNFFFFILWLFEVLVLLCHCVSQRLHVGCQVPLHRFTF